MSLGQRPGRREALLVDGEHDAVPIRAADLGARSRVDAPTRRAFGPPAATLTKIARALVTPRALVWWAGMVIWVMAVEALQHAGVRMSDYFRTPPW